MYHHIVILSSFYNQNDININYYVPKYSSKYKVIDI